MRRLPVLPPTAWAAQVDILSLCLGVCPGRCHEPGTPRESLLRMVVIRQCGSPVSSNFGARMRSCERKATGLSSGPLLPNPYWLCWRRSRRCMRIFRPSRTCLLIQSISDALPSRYQHRFGSGPQPTGESGTAYSEVWGNAPVSLGQASAEPKPKPHLSSWMADDNGDWPTSVGRDRRRVATRAQKKTSSPKRFSVASIEMPDADKIRTHLKFLSSDLLEGGTAPGGATLWQNTFGTQFALYGLVSLFFLENFSGPRAKR